LRGWKKRLLCGGFLVFIVINFLIISQKIRRHSNIQYVQEYEIIPSLKDGDVICRLGDRPWSLFFKEVSPIDKRFSHLGIIRIRDNVISVINAEGLAVEGKDYVNEVPLKAFLSIARSIGIYRLINIDGNIISDRAVEFKGRPFDWQFDMDEDDKLYCSELLYAILKKLSPDIKLHVVWLKEIGKNIVPIDICSQSEYFVQIGYWQK
jgi:hypothetical protein